MKLSSEARLVIAVAYVGLTVLLFNAGASLARPAHVEAEAPLSSGPVIVAKAALLQR